MTFSMAGAISQGGRDVNFVLVDEKPDVVPGASGGERSVAAQNVLYGREGSLFGWEN